MAELMAVKRFICTRPSFSFLSPFGQDACDFNSYEAYPLTALKDCVFFTWGAIEEIALRRRDILHRAMYYSQRFQYRRMKMNGSLKIS
mmetsp:Transcript_29746/g.76834  ORF Transcript_29746/g.76834 Transcript_29746/m.76834 type:complete len:88 (+) Transcript_29746:1414-1677(+)